MRPPTAATLLNIWEQGQIQPPVHRALLLLVAACPDHVPDALAHLSIGQRDSLLLCLRELLFGPRLASVSACPRCGERLELSFAVSDIIVGPEPCLEEEQSIKSGSYKVRFRLPNSLDMLTLADHTRKADLRQCLLQRCIIAITQHGKVRDLAGVPESVLETVVQQMASLDSQADVQLDMTCPACEHRWLAGFDILSYLWSEIDTWAHRTLQEVHILASLYGWAEADILNLSPWRRQYYLSMIQ